MRLDLEDPREDAFNLTPLIDVVFLLLVFFLVSTTFAKDEVEMDLELPEATSGDPSSDGHLLVISVAENGELRVDGRAVSEEALRQKLSAAAQRNNKQEVLIRGDTRVHFGRVAQAFDACLAASLKRISVAALPAGVQPR